ncbi:MAG: sodium-independent anion transporter, partial [Eudoraea sp.]
DVFIKHLKGPLFFGTTSDFLRLAEQIPKTARIVILRLGRMQYMDQSGLYAMEEVLQELRKNDIMPLFVNILDQPKYMMERIDIIPDLVPKEHIFKKFDECVKWIEQWDMVDKVKKDGFIINMPP